MREAMSGKEMDMFSSFISVVVRNILTESYLGKTVYFSSKFQVSIRD